MLLSSYRVFAIDSRYKAPIAQRNKSPVPHLRTNYYSPESYWWFRQGHLAVTGLGNYWKRGQPPFGSADSCLVPPIICLIFGTGLSHRQLFYGYFACCPYYQCNCSHLRFVCDVKIAPHILTVSISDDIINTYLIYFLSRIPNGYVKLLSRRKSWSFRYLT